MKVSSARYRLFEENGSSHNPDAILTPNKSIQTWCRSTLVTALLVALATSLSINIFTGISYLQSRHVQTYTVIETSPFGAPTPGLL